MDYLFKGWSNEVKHFVKGHCYIPCCEDKEKYVSLIDTERHFQYRVEEDTICVFTGLRDKEGQQIFYDDICYYKDINKICIVRLDKVSCKMCLHIEGETLVELTESLAHQKLQVVSNAHSYMEGE